MTGHPGRCRRRTTPPSLDHCRPSATPPGGQGGHLAANGRPLPYWTSAEHRAGQPGCHRAQRGEGKRSDLDSPAAGRHHHRGPREGGRVTQLRLRGAVPTENPEQPLLTLIYCTPGGLGLQSASAALALVLLVMRPAHTHPCHITHPCHTSNLDAETCRLYGLRCGTLPCEGDNSPAACAAHTVTFRVCLRQLPPTPSRFRTARLRSIPGSSRATGTAFLAPGFRMLPSTSRPSRGCCC